MIEKSYSQFGEDLLIEKIFPKGYKGICVDVGATDGIGMSNTYGFEKSGWLSICVEANPEMARSLQENRQYGYWYAIGKDDLDSVSFNVVNLGGSNETAVSALEIDQRLLNDHKNMDPVIRQVEVPMRKLDTLLDEIGFNGLIDFLSIDTEGTELDVLRGFNIQKWSPKLFVIENNYNDPMIEAYLNGFGYVKIIRNVVNDFYIKSHV
jgi:FkbM family methyltransferase